MSGMEADCQRAGPKLLSCLWPLILYVFLLSGKLKSKVMKRKVLGGKKGRDFLTGLLSSLGVRGSCWLVSVVSESCSDTVETKKQEKLKMIFNHFTNAVFFFKVVFFVSNNTLTGFASLPGQSSRQLTLYLLRKNKNKKMSIKTKRNSNLFVFLNKKFSECLLTVEVSLSRAFIWRISLQMSLLPSESSSDLQHTNK